jgi:O-antigen/teichoic acid export membrane protein
MTGRHRSELAICSVGGLVLVVICLLLIPVMGQAGAAVASVSAFATINIIRFAYVSRVLGFVPGRLIDFTPPIAGLATAWLARYLVDSAFNRTLVALIAACCLFTLLYGLVSALFFVDRSNLQILRAKALRESGP